MNLLDEAPNAAEAGGKARHLTLLRHHGLPVPDFFVIPAAWSRQRNDGVAPALLQQLQDELAARGWQQTALAVRSSAVGEDAAIASFDGIYRSCLNVTGASALVHAVADVWGSLDTPTAAAYRQPTRATPAWVPSTTISHHIYAAWTWGTLCLLWLIWHRRRFVKRDEE